MRKMGGRTAAALLIGVFLAGGCSVEAPQRHSIYLLLDLSDFEEEGLEYPRHLIQRLLSQLRPGEGLAVARIDTGSFSGRDVIAQHILNGRPSLANQEKRALNQEITAYLEAAEPSPFTDITGGLLQAREWLVQQPAARKIVVILSDLRQSQQEGYGGDFRVDLKGLEVVAVDVRRFEGEPSPPRYPQSLSRWRQRIEANGGQWRVLGESQGPAALLPKRARE